MAPLFAPVTKYNADVVTPAQLPYFLRQAFREATSGAPGPAHLDLLGHSGRPLELAEFAAPVLIEETFASYPPFRPAPDDAAVERAAPVICFTGDGGFWYHLSELETASRFNINTVTIINNNGGLAQGIDDIHSVYGDRAGNPGELYRFNPVSFAHIAQEMGCIGIRVDEPGQIGVAIRQALAAGRPTVVEVATGLQYRAPKPWSPAS